MRNWGSSVRWLLSAIVVAATIGPLAPSAAGQSGPPDRPGRPPEGRPGTAPAEIQRMLDGYELMQAQEMLQLGDDQLPKFLPKLRALQEARRRAQVQRIRVIQDLRRMTKARSAQDEPQIKESLKTLDDLDARSASEIREARESLQQVLDPFQQARFRLFEAMMEQRKLELVMRARQANRQSRPRTPPVP